jgi:hypothetical protein
MGHIMHDIVKPNRMSMKEFVIEQLMELWQKILHAQVFWSYVVLKWLPKFKMWVMSNTNLPYIGQDTNTTIKSYHENLKTTLKVVKSWLFGRWADWCIHELLGDFFHIIGVKVFRRIGDFSPTKNMKDLY